MRRGPKSVIQTTTMARGDPFDVDAYLAQPLVARVATAAPTVRPVWFLWEEGAFWWITGSYARLPEFLAEDPRVALVVDTCDLDSGEVLQVSARGEAELVPFDAARARRKLARYLGSDEARWPPTFRGLDDHRFVRLVPRRLTAKNLSYPRDASARPSGTARGMDANDVLLVLDRLDQSQIPFWVDGGWGVDALLGGQTRSHEDLDLVIARSDCPRAEAALAESGFSHDPSVEPGLPARLVLRAADGRRVDLHPIVIDAGGDGWQELGAGAWGAYPADGLTGEGLVEERSVRCVTPQLQLRHHLGYPPAESDRRDLRLLAETFGLALPPGF